MIRYKLEQLESSHINDDVPTNTGNTRGSG